MNNILISGLLFLQSLAFFPAWPLAVRTLVELVGGSVVSPCELLVVGVALNWMCLAGATVALYRLTLLVRRMGLVFPHPTPFLFLNFEALTRLFRCSATLRWQSGRRRCSCFRLQQYSSLRHTRKVFLAYVYSSVCGCGSG